MRQRTNGTASRSTVRWRFVPGALSLFILAVGTVNAVAPPASDGIAEESEVAAGPQSLSIASPVTLAAGTSETLAPDAVCATTVLPNNGGTSGNGRAPLANFRGIKTVYLITAAELGAAGFPTGASPTAIGWHYSTAPSAARTGTLKVSLQNTSDTTYTKGTSYAAALTGMTLVHSSTTTTLPATTTPFDITFVGGSPFTYTGGGLYVAFEWQQDAVAVTTLGVIACNNSIASPIVATSQTTATGGASDTIATGSAFRAETRLTVTINNDVGVDYVISLGSLAQPLVGPQTVQAVVTNHGNASTNVPVTLNITGADTFSNVQTIATLAACGGQATVTFAPFTPGAIGSDTVTVSVPADDIAGNNSRNRPLDETFNLYSYKHPGTTATSGVGVNSPNTADFVAKFTTTQAAKISAVNLEFPLAVTSTYRVAIYPDSGTGTPGLVPLYEDAADRTFLGPGTVSITLPSPLPVGPGTFFAGIQQTTTTNVGLSFDTETPIRSGAFFLAIPHPATAWIDFAPGNNFKLNIGVTLVQCATAAECNDNNACTDDACTNQLCVHTNNSSTSCDGNPCSDPDTCLNGVCTPGPNPCNDNDVCTVDLCAPGGGCTNTPVDCNDGNPCTNDFCVPGTGCGHSNNTNACTDNNPCTIGDACSGGACVPGAGALPAPVQACNAGGITIADVLPGTPYPSTIVVSGQPSYLCSVTVNMNGLTHTFPDDLDLLLARTTGSNAIIMSDAGGGNALVSVSFTLSDAGATALPDATAIVNGTTYKPANYAGTGGEAWPAPAPAPSGGSALVTFKGTNPNGNWDLWVVDDQAGDTGSLAGWCVNLVSVCLVDADCNDGNVCTTDTCVNGLCAHTNNTNPCDDGSFCTAGDTCTGGVCVGGAPPACDDGNACTANTCNPGTGLCENPPIVCNDNNTCTDDTCNTGTGCVFTANDANACTDNSLCTSPDVCQGGTCVGQNPVVCPSDGNPCTTEACVPATGLCATTNNTGACEDGDACTTGDVCGPQFTENFDGLTVPDIPGTWGTDATGDGLPWTTVNTSSDTAPNSAFGFDGPGPLPSDEILVTAPFAVSSATAQLVFRNRWTFEGLTTHFDGGILEISFNGVDFVDIVDAGGSFVSGGYNGIISSCCGNPLATLNAWTGASAGYPAYITTVVNLPAAAAGQTVQLQWHIGTDDSIGAAGQNIDSIVLIDVNTCHAGAPVVCDDNNACTDDSCNPGTGCVFTANANACDDGNACTTGDTCSAGSCTGTPVPPPGELVNAHFTDKNTLVWDTIPNSPRYDTVRGSLSALPVGPGGGDEFCFDEQLTAVLVDGTTPAVPGTGFWYVTRGETACGIGTFGTQHDGTPRITTTCP